MNIVLSDFVSPDYGQRYPVKMEFDWRTDIATSIAGWEQRNQILVQPIRHWPVNWAALKEESRNKLIEIANRAKGKYATFLWLERDDYLCTGETIATDGAEAAYQLCKTYYPGETEEWTEKKKDIVPGGTYPPVVTHDIDGAQTEVAAGPVANQFTLDDTTGIMTWSGGNEPSAGNLTVTFKFYFRVRFDSDKHKDLQFAPGLWRPEDMSLVEVRKK